MLSRERRHGEKVRPNDCSQPFNVISVHRHAWQLINVMVWKCYFLSSSICRLLSLASGSDPGGPGGRAPPLSAPVRLKLQLLHNVKSDIFVKKRREICWALIIMHCNKDLYCMRKLEFLASRAPCVPILHHNRLYRSSDYISNYIYIELITAVPWSPI